MPGLKRLYGPHLAGREAGSELELDGDEAHYALRVLRLEVSDGVEIFDGEGGVARGQILRTGKRSLAVRLQEVRQMPAPAFCVDLAVAMPKGPRAQDMIDSLSQLGVNRLILLNTARGTVEPGENKLERFVQSTIESARQCGRAWCMKIEPPVDFPDVVRRADHAMRWIAHPSAVPRPAAAPEGKSVLILVGPEGGWTDDELHLAEAGGFSRWCFSPHVLRIETAAVAAAALAVAGWSVAPFVGRS